MHLCINAMIFFLLVVQYTVGNNAPVCKGNITTIVLCHNALFKLAHCQIHTLEQVWIRKPLFIIVKKTKKNKGN